ncbi:MAG: hypothetical protein PHT02_01340 [Tissierellia bacterium]|nr:hypothetical protein [Tissierellia bacterium]
MDWGSRVQLSMIINQKGGKIRVVNDFNNTDKIMTADEVRQMTRKMTSNQYGWKDEKDYIWIYDKQNPYKNIIR